MHYGTDAELSRQTVRQRRKRFGVSAELSESARYMKHINTGWRALVLACVCMHLYWGRQPDTDVAISYDRGGKPLPRSGTALGSSGGLTRCIGSPPLVPHDHRHGERDLMAVPLRQHADSDTKPPRGLEALRAQGFRTLTERAGRYGIRGHSHTGRDT